METKKKGNVGIVILIIILVLALAGSIVYIVYDKYSNKVEEETVTNSTSTKTKEKEQEVEEENINVNSIFIQDLISRYDVKEAVDSGIVLYKYLYSYKELTPANMDNDYVRYIVGQDASRGLFDNSFSSDDFQKSCKKLFGNQITLTDSDIKYPGSSLSVMHYCTECATKFYVSTDAQAGLGVSSFKVQRKIVSAIKSNDQLIVEVAVAIIDTETSKVYKGMQDERTPILELEGVTADSFDINRDYSNLAKKKYTFDYVKAENNYILSSIK